MSVAGRIVVVCADAGTASRGVRVVVRILLGSDLTRFLFLLCLKHTVSRREKHDEIVLTWLLNKGIMYDWCC